MWQTWHQIKTKRASVSFKVDILGPHTVLPPGAPCSFCSGSKSRRTNFATTCSMPRSCIKISDTVVFRISRSASSSHTVSRQSLLIAAHTWSTFSGVLLVPGLPECRSLSTDSWPSLKHLCHTFTCAALVALSPKAFWIIQIVSTEECPSLMQNLMEICFSTHLLSHFECNNHTVHLLTQWHLPSPWLVQ